MSNIERDSRFIWEMIYQFYKVRKTSHVDNIVKKYGMTHEDVFQVACIAYMHAEKKFDPTKGVKVITFIGFCIKSDLAKINYFHKSKKRDLSEYEFINLDDTSEKGTPLAELLTVEDKSFKDVENEMTVESLLAELDDRELFYIDEAFYKDKGQTEMAVVAGVNQTTMRIRIKKVLGKMREVAVG